MACLCFHRTGMCLLLLFLLPIPTVAWAAAPAPPVFPLSPVHPSVALTDDLRAVLANPAFLGFRGGFSTYGAWLRRLDNKNSSRYDEHYTLLTGYGSFALGFQRSNCSLLAEGATRVLVGKSFRIGESWRAGATFHWNQLKGLPGPRSHGLDIGLGWRPSPFISVGVVAQNLIHPTFDGHDGLLRIPRGYQLGVGLRPWTRRLSLTFDATYYPDKNLAGDLWQGHAGLTCELVDGMIVQFLGDSRGGALVNLRLWTSGRSSLGIASHYNADDNWLSGGLDLLSSTQRRRTITERKGLLAAASVGGRLVEGKPIWGLLGGGGEDVFSILADLRKLEEEPSIKGVVLRVDRFETGLYNGPDSHVYELRQALKRVRGAGKRVVAYLRSGAGVREYYLASAADEIVLPPTATLDGLGIALEVVRLKGLFEELGIGWEVLTAGESKDAFNILGEPANEATREHLTGVVADVYHHYLQAVAADRNMSLEQLRPLARGQAFTAQEAVDLGLADYVGDSLLARDRLFMLTGRSPRSLSRARDQENAGLKDLSKVHFQPLDWDPGARIALIMVGGPIVPGSSTRDFLFGSHRTGSDTVMRQLRKARLDDSVAAVVLRIDSPGGDPNASEEILRAVRQFSFYNKPIVVSFGNLGTSGAYWVGCGGDRVLASPFALTGSIGVIGLKPDLSELLKRWEVGREVYREGEQADSSSMLRGLTEEERQNLQHLLDNLYDLFVRRVSANRRISEAEVRKLAEGRVYTGAQALELGLVDELGGLSEAVAAARKLAGIPRYRGTRLVVYRERKGLLDQALTRGLEIIFEDDGDRTYGPSFATY
jgi:protease IV